MNYSRNCRMVLAPLVLLALVALGACGGKNSSEPEKQEAPGVAPKCASFRLLNTSTSQPAVLKLYFQLKTCDGGPVIGMSPEDFVIMEDGTEVSVYESDQKTITDPKSFKLRTVLLVDMSGSILASGSLPSLQQAARKFVSTVGAEQSTAVYAFDGRADLQIVVDFTEDIAKLEAGIDSLDSYEAVDKSTNLNGALLNGLGILEQLQIQSDQVGLLFAGSLAVFTDGTDQAGRVDEESAVSAATGSTHSIFTIGLGGEVDQGHLKSLGKDGAYFAEDVDVLEETFEEAADDIKNMTMSYYILAYCSPKRAGSHTLELSLTGSKGAALEFTFVADGFVGGCSPDDFLSDPGPCEPSCDGKVCGTDGCGGSCGFCGADESCNYDGTECQSCYGCAPWQSCDGAGGCVNPTSAGESKYGGQYIASGCFGIDYNGCCTTDNLLYYCDDQSGECPLGATCLVIIDCEVTNGGVCSWGADVGFFQCLAGGTTPIPNPEGSLYCDSYECIPDCSGKECGDDGCFGSCGTCVGLPDAFCDGGMCNGGR